MAVKFAGKTYARAAADNSSKMPQDVVLYMPPILNHQDFTCGGCEFATPLSQCGILSPSQINLATGACGLLVPGVAHDQPLKLLVLVSVAGYEADGPYTCGRCKHFSAPSTCDGVQGEVSAKGCCNAWEKDEEA